MFKLSCLVSQLFFCFLGELCLASRRGGSCSDPTSNTSVRVDDARLIHGLIAPRGVVTCNENVVPRHLPFPRRLIVRRRGTRRRSGGEDEVGTSLLLYGGSRERSVAPLAGRAAETSRGARHEQRRARGGGDGYEEHRGLPLEEESDTK
jgi:hypothetical protein